MKAKKQYIVPQVSVMHVESESIMQPSDPDSVSAFLGGDDDDEPVTSGWVE